MVGRVPTGPSHSGSAPSPSVSAFGECLSRGAAVTEAQRLMLMRLASSLRDEARALDARAGLFRGEFDACWDRGADGRLGQMLNQERAMQLREAVLDGPREAAHSRELARAIEALLTAPGIDARSDETRSGKEADDV